MLNDGEASHLSRKVISGRHEVQLGATPTPALSDDLISMTSCHEGGLYTSLISVSLSALHQSVPCGSFPRLHSQGGKSQSSNKVKEKLSFPSLFYFKESTRT